MADSPGTIEGLVEHLFRREAGRMVAVLARRLGADHLELAEDAMQEALMKALTAWPYSGIPQNPSGWLMQVARNRAIDRVRRDANIRVKLDQLQPVLDHAVMSRGIEERTDDQLAMVLMCCHPSLSRESQVALTLKTVSGFGVAEIARALLAAPDAVSKRITRARRQLRAAGVSLALPDADEMPERLEPVCEVLYLLFNEGYGAHGGENLTRADLCDEALRLANLLTSQPEGDVPDVHALLALMFLQASRLHSRTDESGALVLLSDHARESWDHRLIERGMRHLDRAAGAARVTAYHLEAGIAACHATAHDYASTDWKRILGLYDALVALNPSPIVRLNRAVAASQVFGPEAGIALLDELAETRSLESYYLLPAIRGDLWARMGRMQEAVECFTSALAMPCTAPERAFLKRRSKELSGNGLGETS